MFLARDLGYLDSSSISLQETSSASETLQLLREGKLDGGALTFDEVIRARAEGLDLVVVLVFDISAGADVVLVEPSIQQPGDIRGTRIGVEVGAVGSIMLDQFLKYAGLEKQDVKVVDARIDQQLAFWEQGQLDVVVTYEPVASQIKALGAKEMFSSHEAPNLIVDVLAFRRASLDKSLAIRQLLEAHFKAKMHYSTNHQDALFRMSPRLGVRPDEVDGLFHGLVLPDYQNNLRLLSGSQPKLLNSAEILLDLLSESGVSESRIDTGNILDDRPLLKASM
ncbi:MAG: ABC transporter substrate-binding protein [Chromatiales bacterium]